MIWLGLNLAALKQHRKTWQKTRSSMQELEQKAGKTGTLADLQLTVSSQELRAQRADALVRESLSGLNDTMASNRQHLENLNNLKRLAQRQQDMSPQREYGKSFKKPTYNAPPKNRVVRVNRIVEMIYEADENGNLYGMGGTVQFRYGASIKSRTIFLDEAANFDWSAVQRVTIGTQPNVQNILETIDVKENKNGI